MKACAITTEECVENFVQESQTQRQPASIVHIMKPRSSPLKGQLSLTVILIKTPLWGTWRRHSSFLFSSLTIRPPVSCLRKYLLRDAPSLLANNQKAFLPIESLKMWRVLQHKTCLRRGRGPMCHKAGGQQEATFPLPIISPEHLLLAFVDGS